jgi:predicted porin
MKLTTLASLAAVLTAGSLPAQELDLKAELAKQSARIAELEKKTANAKVDAGPIKFPAELTPYILIDTSFVSKSNATADGRTKFDMATPWLSGSRWGLKGDIKTNIEGLSVIYKLESEYTTADGAMDTPGVIFNRDAWVGFKSESLGQITIGRQNTLARDFAVIYGDPFKEARINYDEGGWTNTNNFKQLIYFAASVDGTRVNKGITWKKVADNGWAFGAAYNLTSTESNTSTKNSTAEVALGYNAERWHASTFHSEANNNGFSQKSTGIGGNIIATRWLRLNAGYFVYSSEQGFGNPDRKDSAYTVSGTIQTDPKWSYHLGYQKMKGTDAEVNTSGNWTNPFSTATLTANKATGSKDTLYGLVMRHLSKRMEAYAGFDLMKLHDGYKLSGTLNTLPTGHDSQTELVLGIRIRAL